MPEARPYNVMWTAAGVMQRRLRTCLAGRRADVPLLSCQHASSGISARARVATSGHVRPGTSRNTVWPHPKVLDCGFTWTPGAVGGERGGGATRQPQGEAGSDMLPPRRCTPAAMSMPAEKERARNWEERKQQSNWAQSRPTHGSETSPNRTHSNAQGDHEVRALQQPPNAAHAERAISKHPAPSLYRVPTYSTRAGAAPRAPGGARHGGGNRAVTSQPRTGQSTSYGDVKSSYGGAGGRDRRGCATGAPRSANRQGEKQHRHTECGSHTRRDKGGHTRQGGGAQQVGRGNQNSGNGEPE